MRFKITTTGTDNLALRMRHRAKAVSHNFEIAERLNLAKAKRTAIGFSSARAYNVNQGRKNRDYPYSTSNPHPVLPPFLVNIQGGEFVKSWKSRFQWSGNTGVSTLWNESEQSRFFNGKATSRMIGRPILQEVVKVLDGDRRANMRKAVRDGLAVL